MKITVSVFMSLGGALSLAGIIWGSVVTLTQCGSLRRDLDIIDRIIAHKERYVDSEAQTAAMRDIREPKFTCGREIYTFEWVQRLIPEKAVQDLRGPVLLAALGLVLGTIGGVWAAWIA